MRKGYIVIEYGDAWEHIVAICLTLEDANLLKNRVEQSRNIKTGISLDEYSEAVEDYYEQYPNDPHIDFKKLSLIAPEYDAEEWEIASQVYDNEFEDYIGTEIREVNIVTSSDISKWK